LPSPAGTPDQDICAAEHSTKTLRLSSCTGRFVFGTGSDACCDDITMTRIDDAIEVSHAVHAPDVVSTRGGEEVRLSELPALQAELAALQAEVAELLQRMGRARE